MRLQIDEKTLNKKKKKMQIETQPQNFEEWTMTDLLHGRWLREVTVEQMRAEWTVMEEIDREEEYRAEMQEMIDIPER